MSPDTDQAPEADTAFLARTLAVPAPGIPADALCGHVVSFLVGRPDLPCLAVVDEHERPIGIVARERLLTTFARQLMADLYRRRPVRSFLDAGFMAVEGDTGVDEVGALIATAHPGALTGGFVVTEDGRYAGIGTGIALLSKAMALSRLRARQLDIARHAAESANRAKSAFLATMSHEIRTPLNGVVGCLELLHHAEDAQERAELTVAAREAADTLQQLIGDVLDFSKAESDRITLEDGEVIPADVVHKAVSLFASRIRQQGLALDVQIAPDVPARVRGDALRLRQIVINFLSNAIKFTNRGGITVELLRLRDADGESALRFAVNDTGCGFDPANVRALFEPFVQEHGSTTRRFGGTGLGLAICRRLVELMGGRIGAEGRPGRGATFWCEIPVEVVAETAQDETASAPVEERGALPVPAPLHSFAGAAGGLPVLVIDDTPMNVGVARRQLAKFGLACAVAEDGEAGLRLAMTGHFALILVDGAMPVMDGYEFTRRFRAWEAGRDRRTPVVAMTAHALAEDVHRSLDAGMDDHLTKPVSIDRLAATLKRWLEAPAPTAEPPAVDAAALAAALGGLDEGELQELLELFTTTFEPLLERLDHAVGTRDRGGVRDTAHAAKGAARNAAAFRLGDLLATLEAEAAEVDWTSLKARSVAVRAEFGRVRRFAEAAT